MLKWIIIFFLLAVLASILGFGGAAGAFMKIAKFLAVLFIILFVGVVVIAITIGDKLIK
jgi:uncharacterized membrane protein YtjA (UPF0391 family)